jgi:hypothetical protein
MTRSLGSKAEVNDKPKSFAERRKELAERRGRQLSEQPKVQTLPKQQVDDDLIPDVLGDRSEEDLQIDQIIDSIGILDAYRRWIGKKVDESTTGKVEGVQITCPLHDEDKPSAWLNQDKKLWTCGHDFVGGDIYDLAAIYFDMPDYKDGKNFHELRKKMAESYGYRSKTVAGKEIIWREEEPTVPASHSGPGITPSDAPEPAVEISPDDSNVTTLHAKDVENDIEEEIGYPLLDWHKIVPKDTFLFKYLEATSNDDSPEEYHFWHGLLALGHAVGRNAFLNDTRPVYGNLLVCLLGGTGYGKSRSRAWLDDVIEEALPFRDNGLDTTGCKLVPVPASGENLIAQFQHIAHDPSLPKTVVEVRTPVNGIVDYDEFAGLLQRASRQGATLKQIIMGFSDSRSRITSSSNTGGTFEASNPFCSITASTQPKAVRPLLSRTDTSSGFLNRWIFVGGPRKKREVMGGVHSSIRVDLSDAVAALKIIRGWGGVERDVRFTEEGIDEYEKFIRTRVFPIQEKDDTDLMTRLDLTMKRLILLFCINERKTDATPDIVRRVEPVLDYIVKNYGILNAEIGITQMSEVTDELLKQIVRLEKATGRGPSARDLMVALKRKNYSPDLIKRALDTMVALDWIDVTKQDKGPGRPTLRYKAVAS